MAASANLKSMTARMAKVSKEIGAITKDRTAPGSIGGFSFRGIDDVYTACHPVFVANEIVILPSVQSCERTHLEKTDLVTVRVAYQILMPEGSLPEVVVVGEGMDKHDKAANKAMSSAYKNMIFQTFCVPSEGEAADSEGDTYSDTHPSDGQHREPVAPSTGARRPRSSGTAPRARGGTSSGATGSSATEAQGKMCFARLARRLGEHGDYDAKQRSDHMHFILAQGFDGLVQISDLPRGKVDELLELIEAYDPREAEEQDPTEAGEAGY